MPDVIKKGAATLQWGTSGIAKTNANWTGASATVISIKRTSLVEIVKEADMDGFTFSWTGIPDGEKLDITCLYDSAVTNWPSFGDVVELKMPWDAQAVKFVVEEEGTNFERKKDGEVTITAARYANISLT
jgi:hypothetical protein